MAMLKDDKKKLAKTYTEAVEAGVNTVIVKHLGVPVNNINALRMDLEEKSGQLQVIKKRVFLKGIEGKYEGLTLDQLDGSIAMLVSKNEDDQHAPLKVIQKHVKKWKKDKEAFVIEYVGGWYEGEWKDAAYVGELANLPSKEELIGKFLYMLNHPVSSFARVLQAVADKDGESSDAPIDENNEDKVEETAEKEENKAEEVAEKGEVEIKEEKVEESSKEETKEDKVEETNEKEIDSEESAE